MRNYNKFSWFIECRQIDNIFYRQTLEQGGFSLKSIIKTVIPLLKQGTKAPCSERETD